MRFQLYAEWWDICFISNSATQENSKGADHHIWCTDILWLSCALGRTNINFFLLLNLMDSVPKVGIWRDLKFVRYADAISKFLIFWVHSRHIQFYKFVGLRFRGWKQSAPKEDYFQILASVVYFRPILDGSDALYLLLILDFCVINQNQNPTFIQYNSKNSTH
jgi:hypothetical protein